LQNFYPANTYTTQRLRTKKTIYVLIYDYDIANNHHSGQQESSTVAREYALQTTTYTVPVAELTFKVISGKWFYISSERAYATFY